LGFDRELVIPRLGFTTVQHYYAATSPLYFLADLYKPVLIIYAADDPLFDPTLVPELCDIASKQPHLNLLLTPHGGHVGHISSKACQKLNIDRDPWWSWNRILEWIQ
jgi:predicted alpha/beta-fold hydrolase